MYISFKIFTDPLFSFSWLFVDHIFSQSLSISHLCLILISFPHSCPPSPPIHSVLTCLPMCQKNCWDTLYFYFSGTFIPVIVEIGRKVTKNYVTGSFLMGTSQLNLLFHLSPGSHVKIEILPLFKDSSTTFLLSRHQWCKYSLLGLLIVFSDLYNAVLVQVFLDGPSALWVLSTRIF